MIAAARAFVRTRLSIVQHINRNRAFRRIVFHRLPSLSASGTVDRPDQHMHDPSHDYDQVGNTPELIICSDCKDHPMEMELSDAVTLIFKTVAQSMDYEFEMDLAGNVCIVILSL